MAADLSVNFTGLRFRNPFRLSSVGYFMLRCGTVQVCTAAMLDHAIAPNVVKTLNDGMRAFLEANAERGWKSLEDFRGLRRDRIVKHSRIRRSERKEYFGGEDAPEGYAESWAPATPAFIRSS
jgi:hypothetical protein